MVRLKVFRERTQLAAPSVKGESRAPVIGLRRGVRGNATF